MLKIEKQLNQKRTDKIEKNEKNRTKTFKTEWTIASMCYWAAARRPISVTGVLPHAIGRGQSYTPTRPIYVFPNFFVFLFLFFFPFCLFFCFFVSFSFLFFIVCSNSKISDSKIVQIKICLNMKIFQILKCSSLKNV
jgi:hypothetical protein